MVWGFDTGLYEPIPSGLGALRSTEMECLDIFTRVLLTIYIIVCQYHQRVLHNLMGSQ